MSRFSLRKVLAVGAAVALGVSGFVGISAPATAATLTNSNANVTYTGTGLKMLEGTDFNVTATINSAVSYWTNGANGLEHTSAPVYRYTYREWNDNGIGTGFDTGSNTFQYGPTDLTANIVSPTEATPSGNYLRAVTLVSTPTIIKWEASTKGIITGIDTLSPYDTSDTSPTFSVDTITADTEVTYTPYVSNDTDNVRDADEPQGPAITITWVNYVETDWTTVVSHVKTGTRTADVTVTLVPKAGTTGWNTVQHDDDISFEVYKNGIDYETWGNPTLALSDTSTNEGLGIYTARAFRTGTTNWIGAVSAANNVQFEFAAKQVEYIAMDEQASANVNTSEEIRAGTKSLSVSATVYDNDDMPVARAGTAVKFYVSVSAATSTLTFNGTTVKNTDGTVIISTQTNSSGVATLAVTSTDGVAGEYFDVEAEVVDYSGEYETTGNYRYDWVAVVAESIYESHDAGYEPVINSVNGKSYTLNWTVTDNFGQPFTAGSHRLAISIDGAGDVYAPLTNGKASYTVSESEFANYDYEVYADLEKRDSPTSSGYTPVGGLETLTYVYVVANDTPSKLDVVGDSSRMDVNYADFETHNFVLSTNTLFDGWNPYGNAAVLVSGNVVNANGDLLPGARVELRGNGAFAADTNDYQANAGNYYDEELYSNNSIVVFADADGYFEAYFASHNSGKQTVTASSGSASDTFVVTVNAASEYSADAIRVSAPKSIKAGRSFTATVTVVDKFGNTVESNDYDSMQLAASSNRGLLVVNNPIEDTLAVYQVKVMLQPLDRGPVLVDLEWLEDSRYTYASGSFAVWSGPAVNATAGAKKGRVVVEAYRAVGQTVNVFVGSTKVASFVPNKANDKFVVKGLKKGNRKVTVKVTPGYDFKGVIAVK